MFYIRNTLARIYPYAASYTAEISMVDQLRSPDREYAEGHPVIAIELYIATRWINEPRRRRALSGKDFSSVLVLEFIRKSVLIGETHSYE